MSQLLAYAKNLREGKITNPGPISIPVLMAPLVPQNQIYAPQKVSHPEYMAATFTKHPQSVISKV